MSPPPGVWETRLDIHPSVFLARGSIVVGQVSIGRNSSVWFNTVLRGDTDAIVIGEETNLQDLTIVHMDEGSPALLGNRITVGHRSVIHGCRIDDDCLIGMGSVILSNAHIGSGSLVGAGSLVREGHVIPPGSLVLGSPAKVVGQIRDAHREAIRDGTEHYAALARTYLERGYGEPHPGRAPAAWTPDE